MGKRMIGLGLILLMLISCQSRSYFQVGGNEGGEDSVNSTVQSEVLSDTVQSQMSSSVRLTPVEKQTTPLITTETLPPVTEWLPQTTAEADITQEPTPIGILLLEFTDSVTKGSNATVTIKGKPDTVYSIKVRYSSGYSTAKGLEDQTSDSDGICSWTWRVGASTKSGSYPVTISDGTDTYELTLTVE
ncbi:MAG: hypothetical protein ACI3YK_08165 [Eubacteriales bacterium]